MRGTADVGGRKPASTAGPGASGGSIDRLMERASRALETMRYSEAERLCVRAMERAYAGLDYDAMARIVLPLQESRRQKRQLATDVGGVMVVGDAAFVGDAPAPGCYLFRPPFIGADAREFRQRADSAGVPVFVLTREPMSLDGRWPIVSVGSIASIRTKVDAPWPVARVGDAPTRDDSAGRELPLTWFEAAAEALGDAAIAKLKPEAHPAWRVDDLLEALGAFPFHEKLHQALERACHEAAVAPAPDPRRPSAWTDDPFAF